MRYFTVATAGHVDHGKTSLIKALTGIDPDRLKEEKERQMTTDLGFAHLSLPPDMVVGFVDVPGHGKFLKNMLAGVGGIDLALLVVAADEGPMPQTVQHVRILSFLGVRNILVALNKSDVCDSEQVKKASGRIEVLLQEYGLNVFGITPVSAAKGEGVESLKKSIFDLCSSTNDERANESLFFPIDRAFTKQGFGTIVTGTLVNGSLNVNQQVVIGKSGEKAKVRRLESFGEVAERASAGQRVAVNLASKEKLARGDVLTGGEVHPANVVVASVSSHPNQSHEKLTDELLVLSGQDIRIYHGTSETIGNIRFVVPAKADGKVVAKVALESPLIARAGDKIILRSGDDTIFGGTLLLLDPPRWLTKVKLDSLPALVESNFHQALSEYLCLCPQAMASKAELVRMLPANSATTLVELLKSDLAEHADFVMSRQKESQLTKALVETVAAANSLSLEQCRNKLMPHLKRELFQSLVQKLASQGQLVLVGDKVSIAGVKPQAKSNDTVLLQGKIVEILSREFCLEINEIGRLTNTDSKAIRLALNSLAEEKQAFVIAYEFAALAKNIDKCHQVIASLWQKKRDIAPGEFRESLGISRKYAMAFLSYFDDQQITRRLPSGRVLLKAPSN